MHEFLCVYFASKRNFLCFFLSFRIRYPPNCKLRDYKTAHFCIITYSRLSMILPFILRKQS